LNKGRARELAPDAGDVMKHPGAAPDADLGPAPPARMLAVARGTVDFTEIVHENYTALLAHAQRILHDPAEAEDCAQEAFVEAYRLLHTLEHPSALPAWLRGIVRHRCLRRLRRRDFTLLSPDGDLERFAKSEHAGDDGQGERIAHVQRLIAALPRHEREVVVLFYLKQCSQQEIAAFLGVPLGSVNNRLHQARQRLKKWENHMHNPPSDRVEMGSDSASRVGTVVAVNGPLVQARFDPEAPLDLFDAVVMLSPDGSPSERMKICQRQEGGLALCLVTQGDEPIPLGASVLNTRRVGLGLTPFSRVPSVSAENLRLVVQALRASAPAQPRVLETGIKAIDLLCPLTSTGLIGQVGTGGVGRMVLLEELRQRLERETAALSMLCLVHRTEPDSYRDWDEATWQGGSGHLKCYWALSSDATDPSQTGLDGCDAVLHMSPLLALQGIYPAVDPEHSWSRLLREGLVDARHRDLAQRAQKALVWAKWAYADPVALELLARRAHAAAQQHIRAFQPTVPEQDRNALERARKLQLFLSQPFDAAKELTGWNGCRVALADTLEGTRAILDGELDHLPGAAFAYSGSLEQIREQARLNVVRQFA
jgi:RNA polymerase sigma factor (sigma-70 family)